MAQILRIRKLADRSEGERIVKFDPDTGERKLVNPDTPGEDHEPWPLAGVELESEEAPDRIQVSDSFVLNGENEDWIEVEGKSFTKDGQHTFMKADSITFKFQSGDVKYKVLRSPGKFQDEEDEDNYSVLWDFDLELDNG